MNIRRRVPLAFIEQSIIILYINYHINITARIFKDEREGSFGKRLSKEENNKRESRYRVTQGDRQSGRGKGMGGGCKGRRLRGRGCNRSFCRDTAAYKLRITGSNSRCGKFL